MKKLYVIAGGSDGYVDVKYTFDRKLAEDTMDDDPEIYGGMDGPDYLTVPDECTYESLGISYPLEGDVDEC